MIGRRSSLWGSFVWWTILVVLLRNRPQVCAFELCGTEDGGDWGLPRNSSSSSKHIKSDNHGFYCPSGNTCCRMLMEDNDRADGDGDDSYRESWGCVASDMGALNATCCSDDNAGDGTNTGCPSGYECRRRKTESSGTVHDCVLPSVTSESDPLMWELPRYRLCLAEESNRIVYGLPVSPPLPLDSEFGGDHQSSLPSPATTAVGELAYYSNLGPIEHPESNEDDHSPLSEVEMALVVVHGANRNGDDYFCSAKATIGLQNKYPTETGKPPLVLVIAPLFLSATTLFIQGPEGESNNNNFFYWEDAGDKDGSWRYGADASGPVSGVSSFDALDALVTKLQKSLPNLRKIVVAGHSSGGQFVQRWSLLTPPFVWPHTPSKHPPGSDHRLAMHAIVANPSSYAYLTPTRFMDKPGKGGSRSSSGHNDKNDSHQNSLLWTEPPNDDDCPGYNQWEWGLDDGGPLDVPYRKRAFSRDQRSEIVDRYLLHRSVIYLSGNLDRCREHDETFKCDSHGLETTCADDLQGKNRYERAVRYYASLEKVASSFPHKHRRVVVPNAGHDHAMMFQSKEGIRAIYYYPDDDTETARAKPRVG